MREKQKHPPGCFCFVSSALSGSTMVSAVEPRRESNGQVIIFYVYYVYMIRNSFNDLYVGTTENPAERLAYHNSKSGAQFTKNKVAFKIVFLETHLTLAKARKREIQIKKWRRDKKEVFIDKYTRGLTTNLK
jgi:putative endonuclease